MGALSLHLGVVMRKPQTKVYKLIYMVHRGAELKSDHRSQTAVSTYLQGF